MSTNSETSATGRTYYPGPGIVVHRDYIETWQGRYRVRELTVEDPRYFYAYPARAVALYCGLLELLLAVGIAAVYGSGQAVIIGAGVIAAIGVGGAAWADDRRNPRRMVLAAWHQGRRVVLFASQDRQTFEQVRRAVVRALEANRLPRP
jgi:hypothetical protein